MIHRQVVTFAIQLKILVLLVVWLSGCGHVAGNYPQANVSSRALPTEFTTPRDEKARLVWQEPDRVHGFVSLWRDCAVHADIFRDLAGQSRLPVHRDAVKMYDDLSREGLGEAVIWAFFARGVELPCRTGSFEVEFADGTRVRDEGVLYVEKKDMHKPYRWTREGHLKLSARLVGQGKPLPMILFLPKENLGKQIVAVTCRTAK